MSKINICKIDKTNLALQIIIGATILISYFSTKTLMWAAGAISLVYLFSNVSWEQKFSFFMFVLPFSAVFKISADQTSLFMFLRLAIVFAYAFQNNKRFNTTFMIMTILSFVYIVVLSVICETEYLVSAINIELWIFIGYILTNTISTKNSTPVVVGLSNSIILTGTVGLFAEKIPQLDDTLKVAGFISEDGAEVLRHAGLMPDPNFFTVLIVSALWFVYYEFNQEKITISEFIIRCAFMSFLGLMTMSKSCALLLLGFWIYVLLARNNIKIPAKVVLFFSFIIAMAVFAWTNPYWFNDILYRFTGSGSELTADVFTTGRSKLWQLYIEKIFGGLRWIFGYGLGAEYIDGSAPHNTIVQLLYYFGVVGTVLIVLLVRCSYVSLLPDINKHRSSGVSRWALFTLLLSLMFLDGIAIETFYYMMFMCFVYMSENSRNKEKCIEEAVTA